MQTKKNIRILNYAGVIALSVLPWFLSAQEQAALKGVVLSEVNQGPVDAARLRLVTLRQELYARTNAEGEFLFEGLEPGSYELYVRREMYKDHRETVQVEAGTASLVIRLKKADGIDLLNAEDLIPTVTTSDDDNDLNSAGQDVSGLLTASRDVFFSTASFVLGPMRFRIRGYDTENTTVYMNGIPMNDSETGRAIWSSWGGLNDVMRNREVGIGITPMNYTFGAVGGATMVDTRASTQRKQTSISYASSNRSFRHRVMATHSTGMMDNGWAFSGSMSWRHAEQGYVPGTYYSGLSYFAAVDKRLAPGQLLSLSVFGAPTVRGNSGPSVQELYDLTGSNFYNPNWGYQTGENGQQQVRNARMVTTHQPTAILSHHWAINDKSKLITAAAVQVGRYGQTALDWYNARDPRPQYYRKLPSYVGIDNPDLVNEVADAYRNDPRVSQIDWDGLYEANRNNTETIQNANGSGQALTGRRANYLLEERRTDTRRFTLNTIYQQALSEHLRFNGGLLYQYHLSRNYKVLDDLLGADFHVDIDRFAERDSGAVNPTFAQNNLSRPNATIKEGEVFGYDYNNHIHQGKAWGQMTGKYEFLDWFAALELSYTSFLREGNLQNGKFPDNSIGKAPSQNFFNYAAKGGATYKIDGRNYFYASGSYQTRAPYYRNAYVSARTRDQVVDNLQSEQIYSVEGGFLHQAPGLKLRAVGYFTRFNNQTSVRSFFLDNAFQREDGTIQAGFVNYIMSNVDKQHMGVELAAEYKLPKGFSLRGLASIGEFIYVSRPNVAILLDNDPSVNIPQRTAYLQNFRLGGTPQTAFNLGINYNAPKYWFVNVNFNYLMNNWVDVNPDRRTIEGVAYVNNPTISQDFIDPSSELWNRVVGQERLPAAFTVDLFGGKSWRLQNGKYFIFFNVGISNVLNNRNIVNTAFEQLRFDYSDKNVDKFPTQYIYNFGINYFANLSLRF